MEISDEVVVALKPVVEARIRTLMQEIESLNVFMANGNGRALRVPRKAKGGTSPDAPRVHWMQTPAGRASASKRMKAAWRKKRAEAS